MRLLRQVEDGDLDLALTGPRNPALRWRLLFPVRAIAVTSAGHRLGRRRTISLADVVAEPLLVLRPDFTLRQLFEAACHRAGLRPRFVLETSVPHALVALARIGHGMAIVPSNQPIDRKGVRAIPIVHEERSLGQWLAVNWQPRRAIAPYAETFIADVTAYAAHTYPGREFARAAPAPAPTTPTESATEATA